MLNCLIVTYFTNMTPVIIDPITVRKPKAATDSLLSLNYSVRKHSTFLLIVSFLISKNSKAK